MRITAFFSLVAIGWQVCKVLLRRTDCDQCERFKELGHECPFCAADDLVDRMAHGHRPTKDDLDTLDRARGHGWEPSHRNKKQELTGR